MAVTATNLTVSPVGWAVCATSADAQGCETIKAAPGAGVSLCIRSLSISCVSAITVTVGEGEATSAVESPIIGPVEFTATSGSPVNVTFNPPIKLTANKALSVDASGAGNICVIAQGYTE